MQACRGKTWAMHGGMHKAKGGMHGAKRRHAWSKKEACVEQKGGMHGAKRHAQCNCGYGSWRGGMSVCGWCLEAAGETHAKVPFIVFAFSVFPVYFFFGFSHDILIDEGDVVGAAGRGDG